MGLTINDYRRAANDPKFMAARWKQRVAMSQRNLDRILKDPNLSQKEKELEMRMHKNRIAKMKEYENR